MSEHPSDETLGAYLDGELPEEEQASVEQTLAEDHVSRQTLEAWGTLRRGLQNLPQHTVDAGFARRVLDEALRRKQAHPGQDPAPPTQPPTAIPVPPPTAVPVPPPTAAVPLPPSAETPACDAPSAASQSRPFEVAETMVASRHSRRSQSEKRHGFMWTALAAVAVAVAVIVFIKTRSPQPEIADNGQPPAAHGSVNISRDGQTPGAGSNQVTPPTLATQGSPENPGEPPPGGANPAQPNGVQTATDTGTRLQPKIDPEFMATPPPLEDVPAMVVALLDSNRDGRVTDKETQAAVVAFLQHANAALPSPAGKQILAALDNNGDDMLSRAEALGGVAKARIQFGGQGAQAKAIFDKLDADRNGQLTALEVKANLQLLGPAAKTLTARIAMSFQRFDINRDGAISVVEVEMQADMFVPLFRASGLGDASPDERLDALARQTLTRLDRDNDRRISRAEAARDRQVKASFAKADRDADGFLSENEIASFLRETSQ